MRTAPASSASLRRALAVAAATLIAVPAAAQPAKTSPAKPPRPAPATPGPTAPAAGQDAAPAPIPADPARARAAAKTLSDRAQAHFDLGEYDDAIVDFKEAYRVFPTPGLLYNLGQAYRLKGDCGAALTMYRNYLRLAPDTVHRAVVEKHIADMQVCEQARKETQPPATLPSVDAPPAASPPRSIPSAPPRSEDGGMPSLQLSGLIAMGAGVLVMGTGGYFLYDATQAEKEVEDYVAGGGAWSGISDVDEQGKRSEKVGIVLLAGGGAALVTGAVLYLLGRDDESAPAIAVAPTPGGSQLLVSWGF